MECLNISRRLPGAPPLPSSLPADLRGYRSNGSKETESRSHLEARGTFHSLVFAYYQILSWWPEADRKVIQKFLDILRLPGGSS